MCRVRDHSHSMIWNNHSSVPPELLSNSHHGRGGNIYAQGTGAH